MTHHAHRVGGSSEYHSPNKRGSLDPLKPERRNKTCWCAWEQGWKDLPACYSSWHRFSLVHKANLVNKQWASLKILQMLATCLARDISSQIQEGLTPSWFLFLHDISMSFCCNALSQCWTTARIVCPWTLVKLFKLTVGFRSKSSRGTRFGPWCSLRAIGQYSCASCY